MRYDIQIFFSAFYFARLIKWLSAKQYFNNSTWRKEKNYQTNSYFFSSTNSQSQSRRKIKKKNDGNVYTVYYTLYSYNDTFCTVTLMLLSRRIILLTQLAKCYKYTFFPVIIAVKVAETA